MTVRRFAVVLVVLLAACGQESGEGIENRAVANTSPSDAAAESNAAAASNGVAVQNEASADANATADQLGSLPSANAELRFVGLWATSKANCAAKPWRFTASELRVTDGPHCKFYKVSKSPGGYDIAAQCPTKEPVHADLIKLRFAESARAMLVESNAISPTGLIYCGKDA